MMYCTQEKKPALHTVCKWVVRKLLPSSIWYNKFLSCAATIPRRRRRIQNNNKKIGKKKRKKITQNARTFEPFVESPRFLFCYFFSVCLIFQFVFLVCRLVNVCFVPHIITHIHGKKQNRTFVCDCFENIFFSFLVDGIGADSDLDTVRFENYVD